MGEILLSRWSRDQCSAKPEKRFHFSVRLGFGIGLGLGYNSGYWLGLGFGLGSGLMDLRSGHKGHKSNVT